MRKIMMITIHFAPDIHGGVKRMVKFAKYLPLYDWQPVVLTKEVSEYHGVDEFLLQGLPFDLLSVMMQFSHRWLWRFENVGFCSGHM